jgi:predicted PhzF superfamily epimerase YddE/YHI9
VIFGFLAPERSTVHFRTEKAGMLAVGRDGELLALDFPVWPPAPCRPLPALARALGRDPVGVLEARSYLAVYDDAEDVLGLAPDFAALAGLDRIGVIATAPGRGEFDFVSRYFAPAAGVNEDPVTGSAHCTLIPYWAARLGKSRLMAHQVSRRGGALRCELRGDRVAIAGRARLYLEGAIEI